MGRLSNSKKIKLLRIEKERILLASELKRGAINESDILYVINKNVNFGLRKKGEKLSFKKALLKQIMNCPFLLFDQPLLSDKMKEILPYIVEARYNIEKDTLEYYFMNSFINEEEYKKELDELEFCYYKTSTEGKNLLKFGNINGINSNEKKNKVK